MWGKQAKKLKGGGVRGGGCHALGGELSRSGWGGGRSSEERWRMLTSARAGRVRNRVMAAECELQEREA